MYKGKKIVTILTMRCKESDDKDRGGLLREWNSAIGLR